MGRAGAGVTPCLELLARCSGVAVRVGFVWNIVLMAGRGSEEEVARPPEVVNGVRGQDVQDLGSRVKARRGTPNTIKRHTEVKHAQNMSAKRLR